MRTHVSNALWIAIALSAVVPATASAAALTRVQLADGIRVTQETEESSTTVNANRNQITVRWEPDPAGTLVVVSDVGPAVSIAPGSGCAQRSTTEVSCPAPNTGKIRIYAGRGADQVGLEALTQAGPGGVRSLPAEVDGGPGDDAIFGSPGPDDLEGDGLLGNGVGTGTPGSADDPKGNDVLFGHLGNDTLTGGAGSDWIVGGRAESPATEANVLDGGEGADVFVLGLGPGPDVVRGGAGDEAGGPRPGSNAGVVGIAELGNVPGDTATYESRSFAGTGAAGVTVSLNGTADDGATGEGDNIAADVENVRGSVRDDTITGSAAGNRLTGLLGKDKLFGAGGDDTLNVIDGVADPCPNGGSGTNTIQADLVDQPAIDACTQPTLTKPSTSTFFIPADEKRLPAAVGTSRLGVRGMTVRVALSCPKNAGAACAGRVSLSAIGSRKALASARHRVPLGARRTVAVPVSRATLGKLRAKRGAVVSVVQQGSSKKGPTTVRVARRIG